MTTSIVHVIGLVDNHDAPRHVSMRFIEPAMIGEPFNGFTALTRVATRLAKFGDVTTNECIGILDVRLFTANIVLSSMMLSDLRIMCKQVFDKDLELTLL